LRNYQIVPAAVFRQKEKGNCRYFDNYRFLNEIFIVKHLQRFMRCNFNTGKPLMATRYETKTANR
jgi:hypothetical protein